MGSCRPNERFPVRGWKTLGARHNDQWPADVEPSIPSARFPVPPFPNSARSLKAPAREKSEPAVCLFLCYSRPSFPPGFGIRRNERLPADHEAPGQAIHNRTGTKPPSLSVVKESLDFCRGTHLMIETLIHGFPESTIGCFKNQGPPGLAVFSDGQSALKSSR
jgi:hypothetical protein